MSLTSLSSSPSIEEGKTISSSSSIYEMTFFFKRVEAFCIILVRRFILEYIMNQIPDDVENETLILDVYHSILLPSYELEDIPNWTCVDKDFIHAFLTIYPVLTRTKCQWTIPSLEEKLLIEDRTRQEKMKIDELRRQQGLDPLPEEVTPEPSFKELVQLDLRRMSRDGSFWDAFWGRIKRFLYKKQTWNSDTLESEQKTDTISTPVPFLSFLSDESLRGWWFWVISHLSPNLENKKIEWITSIRFKGFQSTKDPLSHKRLSSNRQYQHTCVQQYLSCIHRLNDQILKRCQTFLQQKEASNDPKKPPTKQFATIFPQFIIEFKRCWPSLFEQNSNMYREYLKKCPAGYEFKHPDAVLSGIVYGYALESWRTIQQIVENEVRTKVVVPKWFQEWIINSKDKSALFLDYPKFIVSHILYHFAPQHQFIHPVHFPLYQHPELHPEFHTWSTDLQSFIGTSTQIHSSSESTTTTTTTIQETRLEESSSSTHTPSRKRMKPTDSN